MSQNAIFCSKETMLNPEIYIQTYICDSLVTNICASLILQFEIVAVAIFRKHCPFDLSLSTCINRDVNKYFNINF